MVVVNSEKDEYRKHRSFPDYIPLHGPPDTQPQPLWDRYLRMDPPRDISPHVKEIDLGITDIFTPDDFDRFDRPSFWNALTQTRSVKLKSVRSMVVAESCQSYWKKRR